MKRDRFFLRGHRLKPQHSLSHPTDPTTMSSRRRSRSPSWEASSASASASPMAPGSAGSSGSSSTSSSTSPIQGLTAAELAPDTDSAAAGTDSAAVGVGRSARGRRRGRGRRSMSSLRQRRVAAPREASRAATLPPLAGLEATTRASD